MDIIGKHDGLLRQVESCQASARKAVESEKKLKVQLEESMRMLAEARESIQDLRVTYMYPTEHSWVHRSHSISSLICHGFIGLAGGRLEAHGTGGS
eukprot:scaffold256262_cov38-Prasinocladus_malaysianus.AAC.1